MTPADRKPIDLFLELQSLDRVPRSGFRTRGVAEAESVAEHCFHTATLVWALSREIEGLDRLRALELALLHDLAEVRIGDLPRQALDYLPAETKHLAESQAACELLQPLPGDTADLVREYHAQRSPEARLVKACDRLQLLIKATAYESWGSAGMSEFFDRIESFEDGGFEPVRELLAQLLERRNS